MAIPPLRQALEQHRVGYVVAVPRTERISLPRGPATVAELAVLTHACAWQRRSVGDGAEGRRFYDWALIDAEMCDGGYRWVLMRRNRTTGELAFYRCYAPEAVPLQRLVTVAGRRWTVEEGFGQGKGLAGLDEHQVRSWTSWHRWSLFAMWAHAFDGGHGRHRRPPDSVYGGVDRADLQRDRPSTQRSVPHRARYRARVGLVAVQSLSPSQRPVAPLPQTNHPRTMTNQIYNWSIRGISGDRVEDST
nr:hypothetical protein [Nocardiopsis kunsanensis]